MGNSKKLFLSVAASVSIMALAACGSEATPTPTPTDTPAPTPTAVPVPTPTFTPTPTPIPTPTPAPTSTPTPIQSPTPTPTPLLESAIPKVRSSVVKVLADGVQISGVVLNTPASHVLTVSQSLGMGPKVVIETEGGQQFDGWIVGRDDDKNLALIRIEGASLPGIQVGSSQAVVVGEETLLLGYPVQRPGSIFADQGSVLALRRDFITGLNFLQLSHLPMLGTEGAPIINRRGELIGLNVNLAFVEDLGIATGSSSFALLSDFITLQMNSLTAGVLNVDPRPVPTPSSSQPPLQSLTFSGTVTVGGNPAPQGARLHAVIVHPFLVDIWSSALIKANGEYEIFVGALNQSYSKAPIEFYMDGKKSTATATYLLGVVDGFIVFRKELDLGFP